MKKSVLLLVLLLVIQLCGCSLVPVGTRTSDIETLKNWSFQHNEGTNDYSVFFALLTGSERYVSADVDVDIRIVNDNGEEVYIEGNRRFTGMREELSTNNLEFLQAELLAHLDVSTDDLLIDSLTNTIKVSNHEFAAILSDCSDYEMDCSRQSLLRKNEKPSVLILNDLRKTSKMAECCWQKKQLKAWLMN